MPGDERPTRQVAVRRAQRFLKKKDDPAAKPNPPPLVPAARVAAPLFPTVAPAPALGNVPRGPRPAVELTDVHKTYRVCTVAVRALRGISLRVDRGEYVAIMGASGSGKTTMMNILGCLDAPTSGVYRLNGLDVRGIDEDTLSDVRNRFIGFVFQSFNLIPRTRAVVNVELPLSYAGVHRKDRRERALSALQSVGLQDRVDHTPAELSGGQQQRVAVARALVTNPAMILADEPTGNLDSTSGTDVLRLFERLSDDGRTIILITHEEQVATHARRIVRVRDGLIVDDTGRKAAAGAR
jgi:putative ABC transport system ATP-binding protein